MSGRHIRTAAQSDPLPIAKYWECHLAWLRERRAGFKNILALLWRHVG